MKFVGKKLPSKQVMLLNGAVVLIALGSGVTALRSSFIKEDTPPCNARYQNALRMSLERDGKSMQASDLQAVLSGTDWGLLDNTRVVSLKAGPSERALEFATVVQNPLGADQRPGIGFLWAPQALQRVPGACLAYSIFVPDTFEFGGGGRLPGLTGGSPAGSPDKPEAVSTRVVWDDQGRLDLSLLTFETPAGRAVGNAREDVLARGKWTALEQEVILNTAGKADGVVRVWLDGKLAIERTKLALRRNDGTLLSGVQSEVVARPKSKDAPSKPAKIWLSAYELRW